MFDYMLVVLLYKVNPIKSVKMYKRVIKRYLEYLLEPNKVRIENCKCRYVQMRISKQFNHLLRDVPYLLFTHGTDLGHSEGLGNILMKTTVIRERKSCEQEPVILEVLHFNGTQRDSMYSVFAIKNSSCSLNN